MPVPDSNQGSFTSTKLSRLCSEHKRFLIVTILCPFSGDEVTPFPRSKNDRTN